MNKRQKISLLIVGFTVAAVGGWVYEEICIYVLYHYLYNRGMLHLTLCPIYGFGGWGLYALLHKIKSVPLYFLLSTIIASVFEFACSYLLEWIFHCSYWSYADWIFSVDDRISLLSSIFFGILAVIFAKAVLPFLRKCVQKGNANVWLAASLVILGIICGDFLLVLLK